MNYNNIQFEKSYGVSNQLPLSDLPEICFSGRSNVGKSSLINKLVGRKALARVSTKPGKTVTINFFKLDELRLADLPGYGYAKVSFSEKERWGELMEHYFASGRDIKLVVQLVDSRIGYTKDDIDMISYMNEADVPYIIVATKTDKLNKTERKKAVETLISNPILREGTTIILFSSETREGKVDVWNEIIGYAES